MKQTRDMRTRNRDRDSSVSKRQESGEEEEEEGACNSNDDQDHFEKDQDNLSERTGIRPSFFMRHVYLFCPLSLWVFHSNRDVVVLTQKQVDK